MRGAPREEAPERPLPFITEPTFSLSLLLRLRSQPGGANVRMGTRPWLPVFPPPLIRSPPPRPSLRPRLSCRRAGSNPAAARGKRPSAWVLLPIGRGKSRPGFQLAGRTVRQEPPTARPRPPPCALGTRHWPASPERATLAARCPGTVAARRPLALLHSAEARRGVNPKRAMRLAVEPGLRVLTALPLI